jgi:hypothetical protein
LPARNFGQAPIPRPRAFCRDSRIQPDRRNLKLNNINTKNQMLKIKPSKSAVEKIKSALAALASAEIVDQDADARVREFRSRRDANDLEVERLQTELAVDDEAGILRLASARVRSPLFKKPLEELERKSFAASGEVPVARGEVRGALAAAAREIAEGFHAAVVTALVPLTRDKNFPPWTGDHHPETVQARNFALACGGEVETTLGTTLPELAEMVISGEIPLLPPPNLPTATLVAVSNLPRWQNNPFSA